MIFFLHLIFHNLNVPGATFYTLMLVLHQTFRPLQGQNEAEKKDTILRIQGLL